MTGKPKYKIPCQTINKQNKLPCKASGILMRNGKVRCRIHGGWSTGPKSVEGKIKAFDSLYNVDRTESSPEIWIILFSCILHFKNKSFSCFLR